MKEVGTKWKLTKRECKPTSGAFGTLNGTQAKDGGATKERSTSDGHYEPCLRLFGRYEPVTKKQAQRPNPG
jgi:hypothetical protein